MDRPGYVSIAATLLLVFGNLQNSSGTLPNEIIESITDSENSDMKTANQNNVDPTIKPSDRQIMLGADWIHRTVFGYDRQRSKEHIPSTPGTLLDLEYSQRSSPVFVQMLWLPNDDRLYETVFHTTTSTALFADPNGVMLPTTSKKISDCFLETSGTEAKATGRIVVNLQFFMYRFSSYMPMSNSSFMDSGRSHLSTLKIEYPKRVALGYVLLFKSSTAASMTSAEIESIMDILGPKVCDQLSNSSYDCCENGNMSTEAGGEPICSCFAGYHGACCNKKCVNGMAVKLPGHDFGSKICECNLGWGGDACDIQGTSDHLVSKMKYQAKECQGKISDHIDYPYYDHATDYLSEPFGISVKANKISFAKDGSTMQSVTYGQRYSSPLNAVSDTTNDFLFSAAIDKPEMVSNFSLQVTHEFTSDSTLTVSDVSFETTIGSCRALVRLGQRIGGEPSVSMVELFIVAGRMHSSTFPTSIRTELDTGTTTTDRFIAEGSNMTGLIMIYTFTASDRDGEITMDEMRAMSNCYAETVCATLPPPECTHGVEITMNGMKKCSCDAGYIGPECDFPLC